MNNIISPVANQEKDYKTSLIRIWEGNLGASVNEQDNYFEIGGDSLGAAQLLAWIQEEFNVDVSLLDFYDAPTISLLFDLIVRRKDGAQIAPSKQPTEYDFFGPSETRLFRALHRSSLAQEKAGVVLCYPVGQEYMRIHRTYVELARSLAASGFCVFRFDYYACGDSAGETKDGNFDCWVSNIELAINEIRALTGVSKVFVVGARVGANLVLDATSAGCDLDGIILWEPIVNGEDYLAALKRAHHGLLDSNSVLDGYENRELPANCVGEALGFPFSDELYNDMLAIDLLSDSKIKSVQPVLVLVNSDKPALRAHTNEIKNGGAAIEYLATGESDAIWLTEDRKNKGLVPVQAIQAIKSWIAGRM